MRLGLRAKVVISTGAIISALLAVNAWLDITSTRRLLLDGIGARAQALGARLRMPVEGYLKAGADLEMLAGLGIEARDMIASSAGYLKSAALLDRKGVARIHSEGTRVGEPERSRAVLDALARLGTERLFVEDAAGGELVVLLPVLDPKGEVAAAVRLGFSQRTLAAARRRALLEQGALLVVSLLVTFVALTTLVTRNVIRPLRAIGDAAAAIASGDLGGRVPVGADDEIGALGRRFNQMADQLEAVLAQVRDASRAVATASAEVARSQGAVRQGAEAQHASLARTAASVAELDRAAGTIREQVESLSASAQSASEMSLGLSATSEEVTAQVEQLVRSVETTGAGIAQMAGSLAEVAATVDRLAGATETAASTLSEMDASIAQIERIADETARVSTRVAEDADGGRAAVEATVEGIERIRLSGQAAAEVLRGFEVTAAEIGKILRIIDDVADQTNLLALNAAIIAAQAGEQGRGFAVVAGEIKALAERTGASTREITALIEKVQSGSRAAVEAMEQGEIAIAEGVTRSRRAGQSLAQILEGAKRTQEMVARIAQATQEHAAGSRQVTALVGQISEMTRRLRAAAEEQSRGGGEVARVAAAMTESGRLVRRSAHEQRDASRAIGTTMEGVAEMARAIAQATQRQTRETQEIVASMETIRRTAETTTVTATGMNRVVEALTREATTLERSLGRFGREADATHQAGPAPAGPGPA